MNRIQTKQLRMFFSTQEIMDANYHTWKEVPIIASVKHDLDKRILQIQHQNRQIIVLNNTKTLNKTEVLETLIEKMLVISAVLQAYAALSMQASLARKVKLTRKDLKKAEDTEIADIVSPILKEARKHLYELCEEFMFSEEIITETETVLYNFKNIIAQAKTLKLKTIATMNLLNDLFISTNRLLKYKLDKLMVRFKISDPGLYIDYKRARTINIHG